MRAKIIKIIKYASLFFLIFILFLATAYFFRTDPIMMIAGKKLSGQELPYPENWEFTNQHRTIKVETDPVNPHSVTTLCLVREGKLIIPAQEGHTKIWPQNVLKDNRVRIKIGDDIYPVRLKLVDKDAEISDLRPFIAIKFPNRPPLEPGEGPKDIWLFEVSPR
tara:strand:- start:524 stop:1015 length:492 start_codon:yes stop_codon:yes gene_type:complete